jgi:acyl phosphate:glycerol-3-phosphate acyltransferase
LDISARKEKPGLRLGEYMIEFITIAALLISAYLVGSIPTALIVSRKIKGVDIRYVGDRNMGAHNTFHEIGPKFGIMVALIDITKGTLVVLLTRILGLDLNWQMLAGILAILGHDFPIFAGFKGGQGLATSFGVMLALFPVPALIGLIVYGLVFLIVKNSNIGCGIGGATIAATLGLFQNWLSFGFVITIFLFVPLKMFWDSSRRKSTGLTKHTV